MVAQKTSILSSIDQKHCRIGPNGVSFAQN
jgi:hypothetical protein